ncbi:class I SAM-dependent methyltransferase [Paracoccus sp. KR1-242]|uniref:class I SAM-dependent methyltransferase n=1 Tax=Paracoccus sp. KR1-242 TaxID=3410028 RepID=UPI003C0D7921
MKPVLTPDETSRSFWERHYGTMTTPSNGRPSAMLVRFVAGRAPGRALDLGCGRGDDAIWLAGQGWHVTGADVSETALAAARASAQAAGVGSMTRFECHDLSATVPEGTFDLAFSMFMHSPVEFDRLGALRRAAAGVAPRGLLLIAAHGSCPPWSWVDSETVYPTAEEDLAALDLPGWRRVFVGPIEREATGPNGVRATVLDTVIVVEKVRP